MKYFIIKGYIGHRMLVRLDKALENSSASILPYPHLGLYGDSIILKIPTDTARILAKVGNEIEAMFPDSPKSRPKIIEIEDSI